MNDAACCCIRAVRGEEYTWRERVRYMRERRCATASLTAKFDVALARNCRSEASATPREKSHVKSHVNLQVKSQRDGA
jgi:hypothetical protein